MENQEKIEKLLNLLAIHDCQLAPDQGCQCIFIREDLEDFGYTFPKGEETLEDHVQAEIDKEVLDAIERGEAF